MTRDHVAARTLVKSPPELWAECSDAGSLARHIGEFGEITITRLEPETTVAWEGEHASGTVLIEPSGWGTRVTLTAHTNVEEAPMHEDAVAYQDDPVEEEDEDDETVEEAVAEPDHALAEDSGAFRRRWRRLIGRFRSGADDPGPEPDPEPGPEPDPEPEVRPAAKLEPAELEPAELEPAELPDEDHVDAEAILAAALDSLGQAHHRPFSRA